MSRTSFGRARNGGVRTFAAAPLHVVVLDAPAWRAGRVAHLVSSYLAVTLAAVVAVVGVVGLLEILLAQVPQLFAR